MKETSDSIALWSHETFGEVTLALVAARANEEMAELIKEAAGEQRPTVLANECADVTIVLCRIAHAAGVDLWSQVEAKMAINRTRQWKINPVTHLAQHK